MPNGDRPPRHEGDVVMLANMMKTRGVDINRDAWTIRRALEELLDFVDTVRSGNTEYEGLEREAERLWIKYGRGEQ